MNSIIAAAFALGFNIPTLIAAPSLPVSATVIMYVTLALLGLALGYLSGWGLEHAHAGDLTTGNQPDVVADRLGQLSLNPEA